MPNRGMRLFLVRRSRLIPNHHKRCHLSTTTTITTNAGSARRAAFDSVAAALNVTSPNDWYTITPKQIAAACASQERPNPVNEIIRSHYGGSICKALLDIYNEHDWEIWRFKSGIPAELWKHARHQRNYLNFVAQKYSFAGLEGFYNLTVRHFDETNGRGLMKIHSNSPAQVVRAVFPDHDWKPWKFNIIPRNWWSDVSNQRLYCDWLAQELAITTPDGWYRVSRSAFEENHGVRLLNIYKNRTTEVLKAVYPEHHWDAAAFFKHRKWASIDARRAAFEEFAARKGISGDLSQWYNIPRKEVIKDSKIVSVITNFYDSSFPVALMDLFPSHNWEAWKFRRVPLRWWSELPNQRKFMDSAAKSLEITSLDQWYSVPTDSLYSLGGRTLVLLYGSSLRAILKSVYSDHTWQEDRFRMRSSGESSTT